MEKINDIKVERNGKKSEAFLVCAEFEKGLAEVQFKGRKDEMVKLCILLIKCVSQTVPKPIMERMIEIAFSDEYNPTMIDINALNEQLKK